MGGVVSPTPFQLSLAFTPEATTNLEELGQGHLSKTERKFVPLGALKLDKPRRCEEWNVQCPSRCALLQDVTPFQLEYHGARWYFLWSTIQPFVVNNGVELI